MKNTISLFLCMLAFIIFSCQQQQQQQPREETITFSDKTARDTIFCVQLAKSETAEKLYVNFKILDPTGKKVFVDLLNTGNFIVIEDEDKKTEFRPIVDSIIDIREQKVISDQLSMLFLVDRSGSITKEAMMKQYNQVSNLVEMFPKTKIYISFMDSSITQSRLVTKENIKSDFYAEFTVKEGTEKYLYKAILAKMEELAGRDASHYANIPHNPTLNDSTQKMLFVITDGKVSNEDGTFMGDFFKWKKEIMNLSKQQRLLEFPYIPIHCIYIGDIHNINNIKDEMEALCASAPSRDDLKGKFHELFDVNKLQEALMGTIDSIAADYCLVLSNPVGKIYDGTMHKLSLYIHDETEAIASGEITYSFGSQHIPLVVSISDQTNSQRWTICMGILYGLVFTLIIYLILQYLIPWIEYQIFCKKYITKYKSKKGNVGSVEKCYHCKEEFQNGDDIVIKCEHVVHLECWKDNRNRCPEYGVHNCTKGIHYYNQDKLSDTRNAPYFLMWFIYGLLAGLVSWVFLRSLYSESSFASLINSIVQAIQPTDPGSSEETSVSFLAKIQPLLLCGILLGFFITLFFSLQIEFRKKNAKIWGLILVRSAAGSVLGFMSFLLGSIIIIYLNKSTNCLYTDWIPWAIFAIVIAFTLSFKTDINLKSALIGGLISVLISFVVLFATSFAKEILSMFSYMIYAAGFGIAIAIVHHVSEKYFLRVSGPIKERDIAIYKWMNVSGGFNKVTIGKSIDCTLEMNWDDADNIADKQVEIYLENDRPYCKALANGTILNNGQMLQEKQTILLTHGSEFTIGNSLFTYIEKDK